MALLLTFNFYRVIGGIGVGLASAVSPMYISEIAPANIRGRLVSFNQFAIIFGMLVVYFVNWGIAKGQTIEWINTIGWRYMFISEAIPAALFGIFLLLVPETPRYLLLSNRDEKARSVLQRLYVNIEASQTIFQEIKQSIGQATTVANYFPMVKL